ncbi:MAG: response regulator [Anaerolineales bacterium]|nr:MAG: response regulator [Anaerolineales bacterium]
MTRPSALIIEDDPKQGVIFQVALQQAGFDADVDQDGKLFAERLANPPPALIILDIHLPFASGIDIFKQIKSSENWAKAVVIVATADLLLSKSLEGRADHVLVKPVSVRRIMNIVSTRWPALSAAGLPENKEARYG